MMLLGRFDYNREGVVAEEYRLRLLRLSGRRAAEMDRSKRPLVFAEDVYQAAFMLEEEVIM